MTQQNNFLYEWEMSKHLLRSPGVDIWKHHHQNNITQSNVVVQC